MSTIIHDVAVIGAGISGLAAAGKLCRAGRDVIVLEKSRGLGGRAATRRIPVGEHEVPVDHGAQYFTVRDRRFQDEVARWQELGICFPWCEEFPSWSAGKFVETNSLWKETRYACRKGISSLGRHLAEGVEVLRGHEVSSVEREQGGWLLHAVGEGGEAHPMVRARTLFVSPPPPQTMALVGRQLAPEQKDLVDHIECTPCIAVIAVYPEDTPSPPWKGIRVADAGSPLSWIGWDSSRRKSDAPGRIAVLHGSREFSARWLDVHHDALQSAGAEMLAAAERIAGSWIATPEKYIVHRWRYAHAAGCGVPGGFLRISRNPSLYLIGDGFNGGRLEGAWLSGTFAAEDFLLKKNT